MTIQNMYPRHSTEVQAVIFPINKFTKSMANQWLSENKFIPIKAVHKTANFYRYRIQNPNKFNRFADKKLSNGIQLILGFSN
jgi:hypothetical protein